jgi:hypothetical protein
MPSPIKRASSRCKEFAQVVKSKCKRDPNTPNNDSAASFRRFKIFEFFGGGGGSFASSDDRDDSLNSLPLDNSEDNVEKMIAATQKALKRIPTDKDGRAIVEDKTRFTYEYPDDCSIS